MNTHASMPAETPLAGATPGQQPQAIVAYDELRSTNLAMLDEKEDMSTLKMLLAKKRKLLIGCGVLLVVAIAGVVALVAGGKTADATTGSALQPATPNTTVAATTETTLAPDVLSDVIVGNSVDSAYTPTTPEPTSGSALESATIAPNSTNSTDAPITTPAPTPNATTTPEPTPEPTTTTPAPTTTTPAPTTTTPAPTTTTLPPTTLAPTTTAPKFNDNGSGLWGGSIKIVNNIQQNCIYTTKTVTYFPPGYSSHDLTVGASDTLGPFSGKYTLGVQENVFAKCAYAGTCAWEGKSVDNYCYNFNVYKDCTISYNDCPYPAGNPSPAPDGRKRYSISGSVDSKGVCVLTVNPTVSGCTGECFCAAKM
ncbi:hypothetical protein AC1031_007354 [Aphanomyces cochlioides]|nr:hypothetical protein AC1031_007354 [Aphanomyces cochlioides]